MSRSYARPISGSLREFFLLTHAATVASSRSDAHSRLVRAYHDAGRRRLGAAQDLRVPQEVQTSLSLYRQATLFLASAVLLAADEQADVNAISIESALTRVTSALPASTVPSDLDEVMPLLASEDPLLFDRLSPAEADAEAEKLERVALWLASLVDARTIRHLRTTSVLRLSAVGLLTIAVLLWAVIRITAPRNIALGKAAVASSSAFGTTAEAAVDGVKNGRYGLHTNLEANASLTIDLGAQFNLGRVSVFGRGDGYNDQSIPLNLEISKDGVTFEPLGRRMEPFSEADPWIVSARGSVARHIRLRTDRVAYLVIGEVEVFGKPTKP